jgi:hypothetical protein
MPRAVPRGRGRYRCACGFVGSFRWRLDGANFVCARCERLVVLLGNQPVLEFAGFLRTVTGLLPASVCPECRRVLAAGADGA